jgi:hypothetical protein
VTITRTLEPIPAGRLCMVSGCGQPAICQLVVERKRKRQEYAVCIEHGLGYADAYSLPIEAQLLAALCGEAV